jgi:hypothetical protein
MFTKEIFFERFNLKVDKCFKMDAKIYVHSLQQWVQQNYIVLGMAYTNIVL